MYFIILDDIDSTCLGHVIPGSLLNAKDMGELLEECEVVTAHCFPSEKAALEWNACQ